MQTSRRDFLAALGAFALAPLSRIDAELILYNGNFWTVSVKLPRAQAVAVSGGRFLADVVDHLARRLRQFEIPLACQYSQGSLRILLFFGSENGSTRRLTSR